MSRVWHTLRPPSDRAAAFFARGSSLTVFKQSLDQRGLQAAGLGRVDGTVLVLPRGRVAIQQHVALLVEHSLQHSLLWPRWALAHLSGDALEGVGQVVQGVMVWPRPNIEQALPNRCSCKPRGACTARPRRG